MDLAAEVKELEGTVTALEARAWRQAALVKQLEQQLQEARDGLQKIGVNLAAAKTTRDYLRQLQAEEAERGKAGSGSVSPEAGPGTAS